MARVLHGMPMSTLPDSGDLQPEDQIVAYKADTGMAYRSNVAGLGDEANMNVADTFSTMKAYSAGDYAIYNNVLYKFTSDKSAGDWDSSYVQATNVGAELKEQADDLATIDRYMTETGSFTVTVSSSSYKDYTATFPTAFAVKPVMSFDFQNSNYNLRATIRRLSTTEFTVRVFNDSGSYSPVVNWTAIGQV